MLRKTAAIAISALFALTLCSCSSEQPTAGTETAQDAAMTDDAEANEQAIVEDAAVEEQAPEYDPMVDSIDLSLEGGTIRFNRFEHANPDLTDAENALLFVFDFTNEQAAPAQVQSVFRIQFFQNGAELTNNLSYSSEGGDQYGLVSAFYNEALKGGTVTFAEIVDPADDSPITIMVSPNGSPLDDNYQMMEVSLNDASASPAAEAAAAAEAETQAIEAALQGSWNIGGGTFTYDNGALLVSGDGTAMSGSYEISVQDSSIIGRLDVEEGTMKITLPYEFSDGNLTWYNNQGEQAVRL